MPSNVYARLLSPGKRSHNLCLMPSFWKEMQPEGIKTYKLGEIAVYSCLLDSTLLLRSIHIKVCGHGHHGGSQFLWVTRAVSTGVNPIPTCEKVTNESGTILSYSFALIWITYHCQSWQHHYWTMQYKQLFQDSSVNQQSEKNRWIYDILISVKHDFSKSK